MFCTLFSPCYSSCLNTSKEEKVQLINVMCCSPRFYDVTNLQSLSGFKRGRYHFSPWQKREQAGPHFGGEGQEPGQPSPFLWQKETFSSHGHP